MCCVHKSRRLVPFMASRSINKLCVQRIPVNACAMSCIERLLHYKPRSEIIIHFGAPIRWLLTCLWVYSGAVKVCYSRQVDRHRKHFGLLAPAVELSMQTEANTSGLSVCGRIGSILRIGYTGRDLAEDRFTYPDYCSRCSSTGSFERLFYTPVDQRGRRTSGHNKATRVKAGSHWITDKTCEVGEGRWWPSLLSMTLRYDPSRIVEHNVYRPINDKVSRE